LTANPGDEIAALRALGADGVPNGTGFNQDVLEVIAPADASVEGLVRYYDGTVIRDPEDPSPGSTHRFVVLLFEPDPTTGGLRVTPVLDEDLDPQPTSGFRYAATTTVGPRVIRAYQGPGITAANVSAATLKSEVVRLVLSEGPTIKNLVLR